MYIARIIVIAAILLTMSSAGAVEWRGLEKNNWCSGPKLSPEALKGKVVLVHRWGIHSAPSIKCLQHLEALREKFGKARLIIIGSHYHAEDFNRINEIVKRNSVKYSIYFHAHLADEPLFRGVPFFYLVNPDGKVVHQANGYSQANMEGLEKAISDALANMPPADSLCGDVTAVHFKEDAAKLKLGRNVESVIARLSLAASRGGPEADEAQSLVASAEKARDELKSDIRRRAKMRRPGLLLVQIEELVKTWPSEKAHFANALRKLSASRDVKAVVKLRHALEEAETALPKSASEAGKLEASKKAAVKSAAHLTKSRFPGVAEEVAELLSGLDGRDGELAFRKGCPNVPEDANNYRAPITIIGDDDFIERTKAALSFIEEGAPEFYAIVTNNIGIIQRGENSGILSSRTPPTFYVGERTYKKSNLWYASAIVHDANHSKLYHDYLKEHGPPVPHEKYGGRSGEDACLSVQADFLRAVNAPEATIRHVMRMKKVDYFSPGVKRDW